MSNRVSQHLIEVGMSDRVIPYHPEWNKFTKSVAATIILQQIKFRWVKNGRRPFYKFTSPCSHPFYREGDSWTEELGMSRHEFEVARGKLATRTKGEIDPEHLISYWMSAGHITYYAVNEAVLDRVLADIYDVGDAAEKPFAEYGNGSANDTNGDSHLQNVGMAFAEYGNAIPIISEQNNRDHLIEDPVDDPEEKEIATPPHLRGYLSMNGAGMSTKDHTFQIDLKRVFRLRKQDEVIDAVKDARAAGLSEWTAEHQALLDALKDVAKVPGPKNLFDNWLALWVDKATPDELYRLFGDNRTTSWWVNANDTSEQPWPTNVSGNIDKARKWATSSNGRATTVAMKEFAPGYY